MGIRIWARIVAFPEEEGVLWLANKLSDQGDLGSNSCLVMNSLGGLGQSTITLFTAFFSCLSLRRIHIWSYLSVFLSKRVRKSMSFSKVTQSVVAEDRVKTRSPESRAEYSSHYTSSDSTSQSCHEEKMGHTACI